MRHFLRTLDSLLLGHALVIAAAGAAWLIGCVDVTAEQWVLCERLCEPDGGLQAVEGGSRICTCADGSVYDVERTPKAQP